MAEVSQIERVGIDKLIPYINNAKIHSDSQVTKIASSIREFGFVNPVLIDKDFNVIAGHGRIKAAEKLGLDEVPCVYVEGLTEAQRKAYILADNKLGEIADWDMDLVTSELEMLQELDFDIDLTGFELPEEESGGDVTEDEAPEEVETRCKLGDLWKLGDHRLICGDSTDVNVIDRLMDGAKADMVMTDPPYGINAEKMTMGSGAKEFYRGEDWDSKRPDILLALTLADNVCIWGGNYFADVLPVSNDWLVWHKKMTAYHLVSVNWHGQILEKM